MSRLNDAEFDTITRNDNLFTPEYLIYLTKLAHERMLPLYQEEIQSDNYRRYLHEGEKPPEGANVQKGVRGGSFIEVTTGITHSQDEQDRSKRQAFRHGEDDVEVGHTDPLSGVEDVPYHLNDLPEFAVRELDSISRNGVISKVVSDELNGVPVDSDQKEYAHRAIESLDLALQHKRVATGGKMVSFVDMETAKHIVSDMKDGHSLFTSSNYAIWTDDIHSAYQKIRDQYINPSYDFQSGDRYAPDLKNNNFYIDGVVLDYDMPDGSDGMLVSNEGSRGIVQRRDRMYIAEDPSYVKGDVLFGSGSPHTDKIFLRITVRDVPKGALCDMTSDTVPELPRRYTSTDLTAYPMRQWARKVLLDRIYQDIKDTSGDANAEQFKSKIMYTTKSVQLVRDEGVIVGAYTRSGDIMGVCIFDPSKIQAVANDMISFFHSKSGYNWYSVRKSVVDEYPALKDALVSLGCTVNGESLEYRPPDDMYDEYHSVDISLPVLQNVPIPNTSIDNNISVAIDQIPGLTKVEREDMYNTFLFQWKKSFSGYQDIRSLIQSGGDVKNLPENRIYYEPETIYQRMGSSSFEHLVDQVNGNAPLGDMSSIDAIRYKTYIDNHPELQTMPDNERMGIFIQMYNDSYKNVPSKQFDPNNTGRDPTRKNKDNALNYEYKTLLNTIDTIYSNARLPRDFTAFRGVSTECIADIFGTDDPDTLTEGKELSYPYYASWTPDMACVQYYASMASPDMNSDTSSPRRVNILVTNVKRGSHGMVMVNSNEMVHNEDEIILGREKRYKFNGAKKQIETFYDGNKYEVCYWHLEDITDDQ